MNLVAELARPVRQLGIVDHRMGDFLPGGTDRLVRAGPIAQGAGLTEDAQANVMNGQVGDDVFLLDRFVPLALIHRRSSRVRRHAGLPLEDIDRAVEPGTVVAHKITSEKKKTIDAAICEGTAADYMSRICSSLSLR